MTSETTTEVKEVALWNKIKNILENDVELQAVATNLLIKRIKIYKGTPPSIPEYPAVVLSWERDIPTQKSKGSNGWKEEFTFNVTVLTKSYDREKREDLSLELSNLVQESIMEKRNLDSLHDSANKWRVLDIHLIEKNYDSLAKPREFVLDAIELKFRIVTEGYL